MNLISRSRSSFDSYLRQYFVNIISGLLFMLFFIGLNLDSNRGSREGFSEWGVPASEEIRDGKIWGLITSNFAETNPLFLLFALGWLWRLGTYIEGKLGSRRYAWFVLSSCIFIATMEIAFFGETGYGFGPMTCAMFGFVFVKSYTNSSWSISPETGIRLVVWVAICFCINHWEFYRISYGGFVFGFVWGSFLAYCGRLRHKLPREALPFVILVYAPFLSSGHLGAPTG